MTTPSTPPVERVRIRRRPRRRRRASARRPPALRRSAASRSPSTVVITNILHGATPAIDAAPTR